MNVSMNNNIFIKNHNFLSPTTETTQTRNLLLPSSDNKAAKITENGSTDKTIQVWTKYNFDTTTTMPSTTNEMWNIKPVKKELLEDDDLDDNNDDDDDDKKEIIIDDDEKNRIDDDDLKTNNNCLDKEEISPSHHARRPMNAFLIFCKKHRPIVRQKFPNLENRGVTRILGEWWAFLDENDKAPYTGLAKEYKDAFLSANPDFKWYKLPAPPLRTLNIRPTINKIPSPNSSPIQQLTIINESEFNPGKLADETQLGSLTNLINNNNNNTTTIMKEEKMIENINNNNNVNELHTSPVNLIKTILPPKPIKKRIINEQQYLEYKNINRSLFDKEIDNTNNNNNNNNVEENMTNQDLMDKVVDSIFVKQEYEDDGKEIRKLGRQCKGKRYEKFMVEGKLLGNKRDMKLTSQKLDNFDILKASSSSTENETIGKLDLNLTIKRLQERTNNQKMNNDDKQIINERVCNISDNNNTTFNLDLRINNLPSLSYDIFWQRKKESKKRKSRIKMQENKTKIAKIDLINNQQLVGSKKRKNKQSITHLEKKNDDLDLMGLATLAEVAANTQKISE